VGIYHATLSHLGNCHQRFEETSPSFLGQSNTLCKILMDQNISLTIFSVTSNVGYLADGCFSHISTNSQQRMLSTTSNLLDQKLVTRLY